MAQLRIGLAQVDSVVGDLPGNADVVSTWTAHAVERGCHLVAFPEMMLTGYPPEDLVLRTSFVDASLQALTGLATRLADEGAGEGGVGRSAWASAPPRTPRSRAPAARPASRRTPPPCCTAARSSPATPST